MCRVLSKGWYAFETKTEEELNLVQNWRKTSFALIDACLSPTNKFVASFINTGISTFEEAKKGIAILTMEDLTRVYKRWPAKYRPQENQPLLIMLKSKQTNKATEEDVIEFWKRRPKHIDADQWKSFQRFANLCRDSEYDIARDLLTHISVVEVINILDPAKYTVKYVDAKCSLLRYQSFPYFLFEKRNILKDSFSDEEHEEIVFVDCMERSERIL